MNVHIILLLCACAGFAVTAVFIHNVRADRECGTRGYCSIVAETRQGRFFKVQNTTVGLIFYAVVIIVESMVILHVDTSSLLIIYEQTAIWIAAGMSFYLFYQLIFVLQQKCPLCISTHIINGIMALCLAAGSWH